VIPENHRTQLHMIIALLFEYHIEKEISRPWRGAEKNNQNFTGIEKLALEWKIENFSDISTIHYRCIRGFMTETYKTYRKH